MLTVNGETLPQADICDLVWNVPEVVPDLSTPFEPEPGDLIFTGTPAGVGPVVAGDLMEGTVARLKFLNIGVQQGYWAHR